MLLLASVTVFFGGIIDF